MLSSRFTSAPFLGDLVPNSFELDQSTCHQYSFSPIYATDARREVYRAWIATGRIDAGMVDRLRAERFSSAPLLAAAGSVLATNGDTKLGTSALDEAEERVLRGGSRLDSDTVNAAVALARQGRCWSAVAVLQTFYEPDDLRAHGYRQIWKTLYERVRC